MNRKERLETHKFPDEATPLSALGSLMGLKPIFYWTVNLMALFSPGSLKRKILSLNGLEIGKGTMIGQTLGIDYIVPGKISIGENCVIGHSATILGHEMLADRMRTGRTEIGENVVIGANSTVLPGVKIEDNAIVAAGAVVTRDVEEGQKVAGVPARPLEDIEEAQE